MIDKHVRGNIVRLLNENYLDHYKKHGGSRDVSLIDSQGHPAIVLAGSESWNILPKNLYIVAKGQSLRENSNNYLLFSSNIDNGIASYFTIPGMPNKTYAFSGEIYVIDNGDKQNLSPRIEHWAPWKNQTSFRASGFDMVSLTSCIVKAQEELLSRCNTLNYIIKTACEESINNIDVLEYTKNDLSRAYRIFNSKTQVVNQYQHPNIDRLLKTLDNKFADDVIYNDTILDDKFEEIIVAINDCVSYLEDNYNQLNKNELELYKDVLAIQELQANIENKINDYNS